MLIDEFDNLAIGDVDVLIQLMGDCIVAVMCGFQRVLGGGANTCRALSKADELDGEGARMPVENDLIAGAVCREVGDARDCVVGSG